MGKKLLDSFSETTNLLWGLNEPVPPSRHRQKKLFAYMQLNSESRLLQYFLITKRLASIEHEHSLIEKYRPIFTKEIKLTQKHLG